MIALALFSGHLWCGVVQW